MSTTHSSIAPSVPSPEQAGDESFRKLIDANHVLHLLNIVDAYGHISFRHPRDSNRFYMSRDRAPALVSCRSDITEYYVADASPVNKDAASGYTERFIHSEIYKRYRQVQSVVHAHSEAILPFTITNVPLRPVFHVAASMGPPPPVYDIALHYRDTDEKHTLLVNNQHLGASLAAELNPADTNVSTSSKTSAADDDLSGPITHESETPSFQTVLMRGHGFTCIGETIEEAVYRAVYTCANARVQLAALNLQSAHGLVHGQDPQRLSSIHYLDAREIEDTRVMHKGSRGRAWDLWCAEVSHSGLYKNEFVESTPPQ